MLNFAVLSLLLGAIVLTPSVNKAGKANALELKGAESSNHGAKSEHGANLQEYRMQLNRPLVPKFDELFDQADPAPNRLQGQVEVTSAGSNSNKSLEGLKWESANMDCVGFSLRQSKQTLKAEAKSEHAGLGFEWFHRVDYPIVDRVWRGCAAETAGLRSGDILISVNGIDLRGLGGASINAACEGFDGQPFTIVARRGGSTLNLSGRHIGNSRITDPGSLARTRYWMNYWHSR